MNHQDRIKELQKWLEMEDLIKTSYNNKSWIPLLSFDPFYKKDEYGKLGYIEEYLGVIGILFPIEDKDNALKLNWTEVSGPNGDRPWIEDDGTYHRTYEFEHFQNNLKGELLVLQKKFDNAVYEWHLNQDLVYGLGLTQTGSKWFSPDEDYKEVARLKKDINGYPKRLEIRAEHLKDYLCARKSGVLLSTFRSRRIVLKSRPNFGWETENPIKINNNYRWECRTLYLNESGWPFGEATMIHISRNDVDYSEDIPEFDFPGDENIDVKKIDKSDTGKKIPLLSGELWQNYWITPSQKSPRVRGDINDTPTFFIIDNEGNTVESNELIDKIRYLWFKPDIINNLLSYKNGFLNWYSENTGGVGPSDGYGVHFGVNKLGLINVFAKDIAKLPDTYRKIWAASNITPDGGVSMELLKAQMKSLPPKSDAPEKKLFKNLEHLDIRFAKSFGKNLFRKHYKEGKIKNKINRFIAIDEEGIFLLCKELTRYIIERIDLDILKSIRPNHNKNWKSIKRLEALVNESSNDGRKLTSCLVGIYELRNADSHLPSRELENSLQLADINLDNPFIIEGKNLIKNVANTISLISEAIEKIQ